MCACVRQHLTAATVRNCALRRTIAHAKGDHRALWQVLTTNSAHLLRWWVAVVRRGTYNERCAPPSIGINDPVTYEAAADRVNAATIANSIGSP